MSIDCERSLKEWNRISKIFFLNSVGMMKNDGK